MSSHNPSEVCHTRAPQRLGWGCQVEATVGALLVVVRNSFGQHPLEVSPVENQRPVQTFPPGAPDLALHERSPWAQRSAS